MLYKIFFNQHIKNFNQLLNGELDSRKIHKGSTQLHNIPNSIRSQRNTFVHTEQSKANETNLSKANSRHSPKLPQAQSGRQGN